MITSYKTPPEMFAFIFVAIIVFIVLGKYGKQAIEWALMKLYEFFIQH